jgi:type IV pilus assembly protein PilX
MYSRHFYRPLPRSQSGAVLIIGLIMLLLMTIVALSSVRGSNMQELMAGSMRDQQMSFQAAESGLRAAESAVWALEPIIDSTVAPAGKPGYTLEVPTGSTAAYWQGLVWGSANSVASTVVLPKQPVAPRYTVEVLSVEDAGGEGNSIELTDKPEIPPVVYRLTSRGTGITANSITYLQAMFRRF